MKKAILNKLSISHEIDFCADISYLEQKEWKDRLEQYQNDEFYFIGILAKAEILIPTNIPNSYKIETISSGGLWCIESDSGEEYFNEVASEQLYELKDYLKTLNVNIVNFEQLKQEI
jgi:hypothetical protein